MIIERYLAREVLQTFLAVLVVLLLIFMGRYFALYLADASAGEISGDIVAEMLRSEERRVGKGGRFRWWPYL